MSERVHFRASPTRVCKIATKKVQIFTLATHFLKNTPTDSLFYYLFSLNIIFHFFLFSFSLTSVSFSISNPHCSSPLVLIHELLAYEVAEQVNNYLNSP